MKPEGHPSGVGMVLLPLPRAKPGLLEGQPSRLENPISNKKNPIKTRYLLTIFFNL